MRQFFLAMLSSLVISISYGQEEQALLTLEKQRSDALAANNEETVSQIYDDSFSGVTAAGEAIDKTVFLKMMKTNSPHVLYTTEDVKATIFGETGIIRGRLLSKSKSGHVIGQSRYLLIYLKKNDQWKVIESQETTVIY